MTSETDEQTHFNTKLTRTPVAALEHLELFYGGKTYTLLAENFPFHIGRDGDECQLVVDSELASRIHCLIAVENNQVGLRDRSTNGTVVKIGRANSAMVKENFYPLVGQGCFKLGAKIDLDDPDLIYFKVLVRES